MALSLCCVSDKPHPGNNKVGGAEETGVEEGYIDTVVLGIRDLCP